VETSQSGYMLRQIHMSVDGLRQMSTDELTARLNLVQEAIRTGNVTIVLGPNTLRDVTNLSGGALPSLDATIDILCKEEGISTAERQTLSHDDIIDYCTRNKDARQNLDERLKQLLSTRRHSRALGSLTNLVWHRIYTFDISNALEVAYARNQARSQAPRVFQLSDPSLLTSMLPMRSRL
jgi:hypothetical protein